jgi:head-tail adaptor
MLSTDDLVAMRTTLEDSLPDSCQVSRKTATSDSAGGFTESWATVATVDCRVSASGRSPQERAIADKLTGVSVWTITLPASTDVAIADRLVVGTRSFEVAGVLARSYEISRRVVCVEVL